MDSCSGSQAKPQCRICDASSSRSREYDGPATYEIRVLGGIGAEWSDWLGGLTVCSEGEETIVKGTVTDQPALQGVLAQICALGLTLLSVRRLGRTPKGGSG
jgi:hypothetical protein